MTLQTKPNSLLKKIINIATLLSFHLFFHIWHFHQYVLTSIKRLKIMILKIKVKPLPELYLTMCRTIICNLLCLVIYSSLFTCIHEIMVTNSNLFFSNAKMCIIMTACRSCVIEGHGQTSIQNVQSKHFHHNCYIITASFIPDSFSFYTAVVK